MVKGIKQMLLGLGLSGLAISILIFSIGTDSTVYFFGGMILEIIGFTVLISGYSRND